MVYITEGPFYLGDSLSINSFRQGSDSSSFFVQSESVLDTGALSSQLYNSGTYSPEGNIPALYPKGCSAFYCMKYEICQQQYVSFLNSLTFQQQCLHTAVSPTLSANTPVMNSFSTSRNGIVIKIPSNGTSSAVYACNYNADAIFDNTDDASTRACNFLNWADLAAYLDWAGLRPMTEFEFEKVSRGPLASVNREFSWGNPYITDASQLVFDGTSIEGVSDLLLAGSGIANHGNYSPNDLGVLRNGFAGTDSTNRLSIGATYYGVLEMSGNLWEICVNVSTDGLNFTRVNGDGNLNYAGFADALTWPLTDGSGAGYRGGGWKSGINGSFRDLAISDRFYAGLKPSTRIDTSGGRGVR